MELMRYASEKGINIIDCWMPDPKSRDIIGKAMEGNRDKWIVQGHIGSTWQNGQYTRTRDLKYVKPAFEDLLKRLRTDYVDLGMIHYVDSEEEWERSMNGEFFDYVRELHERGIIRHIGMSTHNPRVDEAVSYETATDDERDYASVIASAPLHSYMGQCTYCGHCRPCPVDIDIAMVNKFYDLAVWQGKVPESVKAHYEALAHTASECVGCKGCETRCPFGVKIADKMEKAAKLFGC